MRLIRHIAETLAIALSLLVLENRNRFPSAPRFAGNKNTSVKSFPFGRFRICMPQAPCEQTEEREQGKFPALLAVPDLGIHSRLRNPNVEQGVGRAQVRARAENSPR